jgi:hypothetical protein
VCNKYAVEYEICLKALRYYDNLLGYKTDEYDVVCRCMAVIMFCIGSHKMEETFKKSTYNYEKIEFEEIGRKNSREYVIPKSCLYGITSRGITSWTKNNFIELNNIEKSLVGCPFWEEAISEFGNIGENGEILWKSDNDMETFYNTYFPDDIPDEWAKNDKIKSHGDGILAPSDVPNIQKYARNFFTRPARMAWNTRRATIDCLEMRQITDCNPSSVIVSSGGLPPLEDLKKLEPVRKRKIVG